MHRWIALILLLVFPLQAIQAANAGGHAHQSATHQHHEHEIALVLSVDSLIATSASEIATPTTRPAHGDCGVCHLVHVPGIMVAAVAAFPAPDAGALAFAHRGNRLGDATTVRPERPKWLRPV